MWYEFKVKIVDSKLQELGINKTTQGNRIALRIEDIIRYYETDDIEGDACVTLILADGDDITVYDKYELIKELIKKYEDTHEISE